MDNLKAIEDLFNRSKMETPKCHCGKDFNLTEILPYRLPCQHAFCLDCLVKADHMLDSQVTCPVCLKVTDYWDYTQWDHIA